ncbi:MAG: hypothetical protein IJX64_04280 [Clostridia bacterium]|nr:hypothetical protein [Clostridia bacterium]
MNMKDLKTKLTSRKFLVAVAGIASGIVLIANGSTAEGVATVIASVIAYLAAEGYIDAKAVKATTDKIEEAVDEVEDTETVVQGFTD